MSKTFWYLDIDTGGIYPFQVPTNNNSVRIFYVNGGSLVPIENGTALAPYKTISAALSVIKQSLSIDDSDTQYVIVIAPCIGGYVNEPNNEVIFPAFRQIWIQGIPYGSGQDVGAIGCSVTANIVWENTTKKGANVFKYNNC